MQRDLASDVAEIFSDSLTGRVNDRQSGKNGNAQLWAIDSLQKRLKGKSRVITIAFKRDNIGYFLQYRKYWLHLRDEEAEEDY